MVQDQVRAVENNWKDMRENLAQQMFGNKYDSLSVQDQTKIEDAKDNMIGIGVESVFVAGVVPNLLHKFYESGDMGILTTGNIYDGSEIMQKIAWTSWDDVSKLGQRIAVELAAFAIPGAAIGTLARAGRLGITMQAAAQGTAAS